MIIKFNRYYNFVKYLYKSNVLKFITAQSTLNNRDIFYEYANKKKKCVIFLLTKEEKNVIIIALCYKSHQLIFAGVAQSVVQLIRNQQVVSSNLITSSKKRTLRRSFFLFSS